MPTASAFSQDSPPLCYLRERAFEPQRQDVEKGRTEAPSSRHILRTIICLAAPAVFGIAMVWMGSPEALFADAAAPPVETSTPYTLSNQTESIQATASSQPQSSPLSSDASSREVITSSQEKIDEAFRAADQSRGQLTNLEDLAQQFELRPEKEDALPQAVPEQAGQDAPAPAVQNRPRIVRDTQKQGRFRILQRARTAHRTEYRRKEAWREENARRTQYARAHDFPQNARPTELWHRFD